MCFSVFEVNEGILRYNEKIELNNNIYKQILIKKQHLYVNINKKKNISNKKHFFIRINVYFKYHA